MRKKIVAIILSIVTCFGLLTGCALFEHDSERDSLQAVVTVSSYEITQTYSGKDPIVYKTPEKTIYKYELISYYNQVASTLINNYGKTADQVVDYVLSRLVQQTIVLNEVNAQIEFGNVSLGNHDENEIKKNVYSTVDSQLESIKKEILSSRGETVASDDENSSSDESSTTYPVKEEETEGIYAGYDRERLIDEVTSRRTIIKVTEATTAELRAQKIREFTNNKLIYLLEKDDLNKEDAWTPEQLTYPGLYGSEEEKSLEREAVRRFLTFLRTTVESDFRITDEERAKCVADLDRLDKIADEKGITAVYPELYKGDPDGFENNDGAIMEYFVGSSYRDNAKIQLLQDYITYNVDVSEEEIVAKYNSLLAEQEEKFNADSSALSTAISNKETVVYYPANTDIYFVKHILVPFTDNQKAYLEKKTEEMKTVYEEEAIDEFKQNYGKEIIEGYVHENGENSGDALSLDEIYADINRVMSAASSLYDKERAFDDLIYKYNTDPGIFGSEFGYSVKVVDGEDARDSQYEKEFSLAAKALYETGKVGAISEPAITSYGAHILYLARVIPSGGKTIGLNDYLTDGRYTLVKDKVESDLRTEKTNSYFSDWQKEKIGKYLTADKVITYHKKAYADLTKNA